MNKHIKLVVSVLFVVIIILAIGITRFYVNISTDTSNGSADTEIIRKLDFDSNGNRIFEGENSLYGIVDSSDKVIVSPEWAELSFADSNICIAAKRIGNRLLTGCIDYEGNITVPFIFRNINKHETDGFIFYIAESDSNNSCVIYNSDFTPYFMRSWESSTFEDDTLTLKCNNNTFKYSCSSSGFICQQADVSGDVLGVPFNLNIYSRVLLSNLDCSMLSTISDETADYLEFAFTGETQLLDNLSVNGSAVGFTELFPEDRKIISKKLLSISDIFIYMEKSSSETQNYVVSVIANTEITYHDEESDEIKTIQGEYKAMIRFSQSIFGLTAIYGGFVKPAPDYPLSDSNSDVTIQEDSVSTAT